MTSRSPIARGIGYPIDAPSRSNSTYTYTCTTPSPSPAPHQHQHLSSAQRAREVVADRDLVTAVEGRLATEISSQVNRATPDQIAAVKRAAIDNHQPLKRLDTKENTDD